MAKSVIQYKETLKEYIEMIDVFLENSLNEIESPENTIVESMKYSLLSGGKRVRGVLTLGFVNMLGGDVKGAVPLAAAVEMIHCYSLIHDDLPCMDDDDMRRGKPSCHIKYGEATALLAGDALLTYAFNLVAEANYNSDIKIEMIKELSKSSGYNGMIAGQAIDLYYENKNIDIKILNKMHNKKTGELIKLSCLLGVLATTNKNEDKTNAVEFGQKLGLTFQIIDDILDVIGDENKLGKPVGSDNENQKSTYVGFMGLKEAKDEANKLSSECKGILNGFYDVNSKFLCNFTDNLLEREF